jgi:O-succinylbenzoate synthase
MKPPLKIWAREYELSSPWHGPCHKGVLLKIEWPGKMIGYADLHPWPELGDDPINAQLRSLKEVHLKPIIKRALELAWLDGVARREGRSLYKGYQIPFSHYLIPSLVVCSLDEIWGRFEEGYRVFKCKMGMNLAQETEHLRQLIETVPGSRWRIDFNGRLSAADFRNWAQANQDLSDFIDGIEDASGREAVSPADSGFPLFADRVRLAPDWNLVIKPEIQEIPEIHSKRVWFTNNLGHPFGHGVAMALAARTGTDEVCGLQGLQHYPSSAWTENVRYFGPVTLPPAGTGFGFDDHLRKLQWRLLE